MERKESDKKIKVAIVEDHDIFRKRLMELLGFYDTQDLIFTADSGELCLKFIEQAEEGRVPHVILMDIDRTDHGTYVTATPTFTASLCGDPPIPGLVPTNVHQPISSRYKDVHRCPTTVDVDRPDGC